MSQEMKKLPRMRITAPGLEFLMPYVHREVTEYEVFEGDGPADFEVFIAPDADSLPEIPVGAAGLVCPNIVGTGMTGLPMAMATAITRGTYFHISGNEARVSTVHATDVARAVALLPGKPGVYTLTDGFNPTFRDLAEALAFRLGDKRIFTLRRRWARWLMDRRLIESVTTGAIVRGTDFAEAFGFQPVAVTEYLRTHVYDDESL